jgi:hypothetical protein
VQHGEKLQDAIKNADALQAARRKKQKDAVSAARAAELDYLKAAKELKDAESKATELGTPVSEEEKTALIRAKEIAQEQWEEAKAELMEVQEPQPLTDQGRQLAGQIAAGNYGGRMPEGAVLPPAVRDDMPRFGGQGAMQQLTEQADVAAHAGGPRVVQLESGGMSPEQQDFVRRVTAAARAGDPEAQAICDERGFQWRQ